MRPDSFEDVYAIIRHIRRVTGDDAEARQRMIDLASSNVEYAGRLWRCELEAWQREVWADDAAIHGYDASAITETPYKCECGDAA